MKRNIIIDTDPGVDDATALVTAFFSEKLNINLITTTAGNVGIKTTTRNTLHLVEKFNKNIPVFMGSSKPMVRKAKNAKNIHGKNGLGGYIPTKANIKAKKNAITEIYNEILKNKNNITLVELGPHTNLGLLFETYPEIEKYINLLVFEGGSPYGSPGVKPHISFNISCDPEAANIVLKTNIPKVIVPSELGRYVAFFSEEQVEIIKNTNKTGKFFYEMFKGYSNKFNLTSTQTNDLCAIMFLICPEIFKTYKCNIEVDLKDNPGKTIITKNKNGNVTFVEDVNREIFFEKFMEIFKKLP